MLFADGAIEVAVARLDVGFEVVRALVALLSDEERQRASRFAFDRDRRRFTVGRARLRQLLGARLGMRPQSVELTYRPHGKPGLARHCAISDLRFNVAHSGEVAVYAFSHGREVGIDLEAVRVIREADEIAAHFFSRREKEAYLALDQRDRLVGFFNCWTRKEAFIKALGEGLYYPLDCFDVSLAPGEPARILRAHGAHGDGGWRMGSFCPIPGFVAAVVVESREPRVNARRFFRHLACPVTAGRFASLTRMSRSLRERGSELRQRADWFFRPRGF
jgi:4'-phosphopantetheinyl transferase